mgnify:CR=1 FL=1
MIFSEVLPAAVLQKTRNVLSKAPALSGIISTLISDFSPGMTGLRFHDGFVHPQEASMWVITSGLSPVFSRTKAACAVLPEAEAAVFLEEPLSRGAERIDIEQY